MREDEEEPMQARRLRYYFGVMSICVDDKK